jgi:hypothetical protein
MRWPRPRFTVRRLMIAVAILAIGFGAIKWVAEMRARSSDYRRRAIEFERRTLRRGSLVRTDDGRWVDRFDNENDRLGDDWARRMAAKYERLSYCPWLATEPDPPPPLPLAHPRSARELPGLDYWNVTSVYDLRPPAWTFLWTWRRQGSALWEIRIR